MKKALSQARKALQEGNFPVGCVLVAEGHIVADGSRQGTASDITNELDHAEIVALRRLSELPKKKKPDSSKVTAYVTLEPCLMCFGALLISGIKRIVYAYEDAMGGGTSYPLEVMPPLYRHSQVEIIPHVMRAESLALFKEFFADPDNEYLKGSMLASYTLGQ